MFTNSSPLITLALLLQVITLENLEHLTGLKVLNIARNSISLEGLQRVKRLAALIALNISQLEGLSGDEVLQCIQGKMEYEVVKVGVVPSAVISYVPKVI